MQEKQSHLKPVDSGTRFADSEDAARAYAVKHHIIRRGSCFYTSDNAAICRGWSAYTLLLTSQGRISADADGWHLVEEQAPALVTDLGVPLIDEAEGTTPDSPTLSHEELSIAKVQGGGGSFRGTWGAKTQVPPFSFAHEGTTPDNSPTGRGSLPRPEEVGASSGPLSRAQPLTGGAAVARASGAAGSAADKRIPEPQIDLPCSPPIQVLRIANKGGKLSIVGGNSPPRCVSVNRSEGADTPSDQLFNSSCLLAQPLQSEQSLPDLQTEPLTPGSNADHQAFNSCTDLSLHGLLLVPHSPEIQGKEVDQGRQCEGTDSNPAPLAVLPIGFAALYAYGDAVEYKRDFRDLLWHRGTVLEARFHDIDIDPQHGGELVTITSSKGKVRPAEVTGTELCRTLYRDIKPGNSLRRTPLRRRAPRKISPIDEVLAGLHFVAPAVKNAAPGGPVSYDTQPPAEPLRMIYSGPAELRPVPKDLPMLRSRVFIDWMLRRFPACMNSNIFVPWGHLGILDPHHQGNHGLGEKTHDLLCVTLCRGCHEVFEATNALPGRSPAESITLMQAWQLRALVEWNGVLFDLITPPAVRQESAADQAFIDYLCEEERLSFGPGPDDRGGGGAGAGGAGGSGGDGLADRVLLPDDRQVHSHLLKGLQGHHLVSADRLKQFPAPASQGIDLDPPLHGFDHPQVPHPVEGVKGHLALAVPGLGAGGLHFADPVGRGVVGRLVGVFGRPFLPPAGQVRCHAGLVSHFQAQFGLGQDEPPAWSADERADDEVVARKQHGHARGRAGVLPGGPGTHHLQAPDALQVVQLVGAGLFGLLGKLEGGLAHESSIARAPGARHSGVYRTKQREPGGVAVHLRPALVPLRRAAEVHHVA